MDVNFCDVSALWQIGEKTGVQMSSPAQ